MKKLRRFFAVSATVIMLQTGLVFPVTCLQAASFSLVSDTVSAPQKNRTLLYSGIAGAAYIGGLAVLSQAWYDQKTKKKFHWFNDNSEWKQLDKAGHFWSTFHLSRAGIDVLKNAGVSEKKAILFGSLTGVLLLSPIEIFDGYQQSYGASAGDLFANAAGSAGVLAQHLLWNEIRITPKFSFHKSRYAALRPNVLGSNLPERMLKDYNGQTYWLSFGVAKFLPGTSRYPKWLNVAIGYGAEEMVFNDPDANRRIGIETYNYLFEPYRQYYLTLDLNLSSIQTRSKVLKTIFYVADIFHLPAPALEFNNRKKLVFHPVYF